MAKKKHHNPKEGGTMPDNKEQVEKELTVVDAEKDISEPEDVIGGEDANANMEEGVEAGGVAKMTDEEVADAFGKNKQGENEFLTDEEIDAMLDDSEEDKTGLVVENTPSVDSEEGIKLEDSTYPPKEVLIAGTDFIGADEVVLAFDKTTINTLINEYMDVELASDENTSMLNTVENQKARHLISTLNKINTESGDKAVTKILSYLNLYMEPTDIAKNPGMLMQLIAKEVNEAKTIDDLDMAMYILTRIFKSVASFNIRSFLKIGSEFHPEFKINALQMVEVFSQLATADERKAKVNATISLQKSFKTSTTFLNTNGARLMIEYFSK